MLSNLVAEPEVLPLGVLCQFLRAMADDHRLVILQSLFELGEQSVSQLCQILGQSQPAVSHHLNQLREAGLVTYRRSGKFNFYRLYDEGFERLIASYSTEGQSLTFTWGDYEMQLRKK